MIRSIFASVFFLMLYNTLHGIMIISLSVTFVLHSYVNKQQFLCLFDRFVTFYHNLILVITKHNGFLCNITFSEQMQFLTLIIVVNTQTWAPVNPENIVLFLYALKSFRLYFDTKSVRRS